jgi:SulP family sulfate permease
MPVINKLPLKDLIIFSTVLLITVYEDLMVAIAAGIIFAILSSLKDLKNIIKEKEDYQFFNVTDSDYKNDIKLKSANDSRINVLLPSGPLFFGSIEKLIKSYNKIPGDSNVIIDMKNITYVDLSGVFGLEDLFKLSQLQNRKVIITNMKDEINKSFNDLKFIENVGLTNFCKSKEEVIQKINNSFFK